MQCAIGVWSMGKEWCLRDVLLQGRVPSDLQMAGLNLDSICGNSLQTSGRGVEGDGTVG